MEEIIQIKCPYCGAVLSVKNQPGMETKSVTCPICKQKSPFTDFRRVVPKPAEEATQYPGGGEHTRYGSGDDPTQTHSGLNYTLGRLTGPALERPYQLRPGRNVVGRQASTSQADCQIPAEGSKRMSREHIVIEVRRVPGKGFVHYASLYKETVNPTLVNSEPLVWGDCIVLRDGDTIRLPDATVKFEIPDEEKTDM